jgi:hypothetical protein
MWLRWSKRSAAHVVRQHANEATTDVERLRVNAFDKPSGSCAVNHPNTVSINEPGGKWTPNVNAANLYELPNHHVIVLGAVR